MTSLSRSLAATLAFATSALGVGFIGRSYPSPHDIGSPDSLVHQSFQNVTTLMDGILNGASNSVVENATQEAALPDLLANKNLTLSIGLFSLNDPSAEQMQYHFASDDTKNSQAGAKSVDGNTIFPIASVTKVFTVLAGLLNLKDDDWNTPLSQIIPALANSTNNSDVNSVRWDQVTCANLAAHLSGIQTDLTALVPGTLEKHAVDLAVAAMNMSVPGTDPSTSYDPATLGLPDNNDTASWPACWTAPLEGKNCTGDLFASGLKNNPPFFSPWTSPNYANTGFILLGAAISRITGVPLDQLVLNDILKPLGMASTTSDASTLSSTDVARTVILGQPESALVPAGISNATGAIYSTTNDLAKLGVGILNSTLMSSEKTRRWMKPVAETSNIQQSVGRPWEIFRYVHNASGKVTDLYTKSGDSGYATSFFVLVPEFDFGFSILTTNLNVTSRPIAASYILQAMTTSIIPALLDQAAAEAEENYAGTWSADGNSTLKFSVVKPDDPSQAPGLKIDSWTMRGKDLANNEYVAYETWRLVPSLVPGAEAQQFAMRAFNVPAEPVNSLNVPFSYEIDSWLEPAGRNYFGKSLADFNFDVDPATGKPSHVTPVAWDQCLSKNPST